jgi:hypothetical protein
MNRTHRAKGIGGRGIDGIGGRRAECRRVDSIGYCRVVRRDLSLYKLEELL